MTLVGKRCVVTGASSGIGRAVALALAGAGGHVWAIGRSTERLESLGGEVVGSTGSIHSLVADLEADVGLERASREIIASGEPLDALVHSAGAITRGPVLSAEDDDLDRQYRVNLRAPFVLTRTLLPSLKRARGQVVFMNSSAGLAASAPDAALYAATKHGLKAFADSLRQEVNADGVRVLTIYPGRTATPMQESVHEHEGRPYRARGLDAAGGRRHHAYGRAGHRPERRGHGHQPPTPREAPGCLTDRAFSTKSRRDAEEQGMR